VGVDVLTADTIQQKAHELGFDLCGIAPAEPFPELAFLRDWLDRGYAGEMAYMERSAARRADVRSVVPGARSVIVTGTVYNTDRPYSTEQHSSDVALIARYAWGDDYHDVLKARLDALVAWMREVSTEPFDARAYVDTGPVQERVFAQYAGLGWIGKNTCLINNELGSWLFLSEIICTLALEPDTQGLEQCGSCTRCLDACPTGALVESGVLDSNKCLSYLTIELRSGIPEQHRPALGAHVYGCDICQEVCPYNQIPPRSADGAWQPRPALDLPRLVDLWRRPDSELRKAIKGSAMTRAKLTGLRRNLAVAIGNTGDAEAIAALAEESEERPTADDEMVLEHIRWAVTRATI
jgi:epoxyqueuosine reductase